MLIVNTSEKFNNFNVKIKEAMKNLLLIELHKLTFP